MPLLAVALENGTIMIVTAIDTKPLLTFKAHSGKITDLKWSPSGLFLGSSSEDGTIKVWNMRSNLPIISYRSKVPVSSIAWSASGDSSLLYTTSKGQLVHYKINENSETVILEDPDLLMVRVSRDFKTYALGMRTGRIKIFTIENSFLKEYKKHDAAIIFLEWNDEFQIKSLDINGNFFVWHKGDNNTLYSYSSNYGNERIHWDHAKSIIFMATQNHLKILKDTSRQAIFSLEFSEGITSISGTIISVFLSIVTAHRDLYIYDYLSNNDLFYYPIFEINDRRELKVDDEFESIILNFKAYLMNLNVIIPDKHYSLIVAEDIINNLKVHFKVKEILSQMNLNYYLYSLLWCKSVSLFRFWAMVENKKMKSEEWKRIFDDRREMLSSLKAKESAIFVFFLDLIYRFQMLLNV